jgi:large subunit ribosomal protein L17
MPTPKKGRRLGHSSANQKLILSNLTTSLIAEGKIETTIARAKAVRPLAEKMITKARKGDLNSRRVILKTIKDNAVVTKLFDEVAPRYTERPGGYTRIVKIGPRRGDGAEMAIIELV